MGHMAMRPTGANTGGMGIGNRDTGGNEVHGGQ